MQYGKSGKAAIAAMPMAAMALPVLALGVMGLAVAQDGKGASKMARTMLNHAAISTLDAAGNTIKVTVRKPGEKGANKGAPVATEDVTLSLLPTTDYVQEEGGLAAADLKADDQVLVNVKGGGDQKNVVRINGLVTIASLNPLTLKLGDLGTLTLANTDNVSFTRITPLKVGDLTNGEFVNIDALQPATGNLQANRIIVHQEKPRPGRGGGRNKKG